MPSLIKNSSVKLTKQIDFNQTISINQLRLVKTIIESNIKKAKKANPKWSAKQIIMHIKNLILLDSIFSQAMKLAADCYDKNISQTDIDSVANKFAKNPIFYNAPFENIQMVARKCIERDLILDDLAKQWQINVRDEEIKIRCIYQYKQTSSEFPSRQVLNNPELFNDFKRKLTRSWTINDLIKKFKLDIDWKKISQQFDQLHIEEAIKFFTNI